MSDTNKDPRSNARRKAQNHFTSTEQRDALIRKELESSRAQTAAKTARLRALRLAKEAAEAEEAAQTAAATPDSPKRESRKPKPRALKAKRAPGY
jgi:small-conductance mechanosensitive channel